MQPAAVERSLRAHLQLGNVARRGKEGNEIAKGNAMENEIDKTIHCDLCDATATSVEDAIEKDWSASYFVGDDQHDPICSKCSSERCAIGKDGELELIVAEVAKTQEAKNKDAAHDAYVQAGLQLVKNLDQMEKLFDAMPDPAKDEILWSDVAELNYANVKLADLIEFLKGRNQ